MTRRPVKDESQGRCVSFFLSHYFSLDQQPVATTLFPHPLFLYSMAALPPPPEPTIDFHYYDQPSTISYFEAIVDNLRSDLQSEGVDTTLTAPELAHFTARFQQFQQSALGRAAAQAIRSTGVNSLPARIPTSFLEANQPLSTSSPLYFVLKAAYLFQSDKGISDWQFDAAEEKDTYVELVKYITRYLEKPAKVYRVPIVAFDHEVDPGNKQQLIGMVQAMGGKWGLLIYVQKDMWVDRIHV